MVAFIAQSTGNSDGLLNALITVGAAEATHGTGHTDAFVPFVTVSKSGVIARIQIDCWDLITADYDDSRVTSEALDAWKLQGLAGAVTGGEVNRSVVVRLSFLGLLQITRLDDGRNDLRSLGTVFVRWNILWNIGTAQRFRFSAADACRSGDLGRI